MHKSLLKNNKHKCGQSLKMYKNCIKKTGKKKKQMENCKNANSKQTLKKSSMTMILQMRTLVVIEILLDTKITNLIDQNHRNRKFSNRKNNGSNNFSNNNNNNNSNNNYNKR